MIKIKYPKETFCFGCPLINGKEYPNYVFNFGKHKGESFENVLRYDSEYIYWCISNVEWFKLSPKDRKEFTRYSNFLTRIRLANKPDSIVLSNRRKRRGRGWEYYGDGEATFVFHDPAQDW